MLSENSKEPLLGLQQVELEHSKMFAFVERFEAVSKAREADHRSQIAKDVNTDEHMYGREDPPLFPTSPFNEYRSWRDSINKKKKEFFSIAQNIRSYIANAIMVRQHPYFLAYIQEIQYKWLYVNYGVSPPSFLV